MKRLHYMNVRIDEELRDLLKAFCDEQKVPLSRGVRMLLRHALDQETQTGAVAEALIAIRGAIRQAAVRVSGELRGSLGDEVIEEISKSLSAVAREESGGSE